jgi:diguanylate cyclase (GGDEF)-like protein/PAS domain S-box-containing protein
MRIRFWNRGAELITGYSSEEVLGRPCSDNILVHVDPEGKELCLNGCPVSDVLNDVKDRTSAFAYLHHKDGHRVPVNIRVSKIRDEAGMVIGAAELFWENTGTPHDEPYIVEMERAALVDSLTNIPNRRFIDLEMVSTAEESRRHNIPYGLIFADIDDFKEINDYHGHDVGDKILQMVARTLSVSIRSYDRLGRWGGEEFLIIAKHVDAEGLAALARRMRVLVSTSFVFANEKPLGVTMTMGLAHSSAHGSADSMFKRADANLLRGKSSGKNCVVCD